MLLGSFIPIALATALLLLVTKTKYALRVKSLLPLLILIIGILQNKALYLSTISYKKVSRVL